MDNRVNWESFTALFWILKDGEDLNLKSYFEFQIHCSIADKGNITQKDQRMNWGAGGALRNAQIVTTQSGLEMGDNGAKRKRL